MDRFWVKDGKGADRYFVEGELIPTGHKLHIYDLNKKEVASIQNKLSGLSPKVVIRQNEEITVEVLKKRTGCILKGSDWTIKGDFRTHDYALVGGYGNALCVKVISQDDDDFYELDISNTADELKVLSTALTLDLAFEGVK